ncbi:hypothetical protein ANO11243_067890 [Dothideomycetidae sp. 11243]|nr:hypothetical protein ANO11243_067890 [fungal sp. No.11243]
MAGIKSSSWSFSPSRWPISWLTTPDPQQQFDYVSVPHVPGAFPPEECLPQGSGEGAVVKQDMINYAAAKLPEPTLPVTNDSHNDSHRRSPQDTRHSEEILDQRLRHVATGCATSGGDGKEPNHVEHLQPLGMNVRPGHTRPDNRVPEPIIVPDARDFVADQGKRLQRPVSVEKQSTKRRHSSVKLRGMCGMFSGFRKHELEGQSCTGYSRADDQDNFPKRILRW